MSTAIRIGGYKAGEDLPRIPRVIVDYAGSPNRPYMLGEPRGWHVGSKNSCWIAYPEPVDSKRGEFRSDGTSIPPGLRWLISKDDPELLYAAIVHDWLYRFGFVWRCSENTEYPTARYVTRRQCDKVMDEILIAYGLTGWKRRSIKAGLWVGGAWGWKRNEEARNRNRGFTKPPPTAELKTEGMVWT